MSNNKKLKKLVLFGLSSAALVGSQMYAGSTASNADNMMADSSQQTMTPEQQSFCNRLSGMARHAFKNMSNDNREMCMRIANQECKGKNECKGMGNCANPGDHACSGKNDCKGKGGCKAKEPNKAVHMVEKMAQKRANAME
jgi:hypothetical protein